MNRQDAKGAKPGGRERTEGRKTDSDGAGFLLSPALAPLASWRFILFFLLLSSADAAGWKAGAARVAITPKQPMWMAGYAARKTPSEGVLHDLWAKALVLEDPEGTRAALVTLDICGIGRPLSIEVRDRLKSDYGLARDRVVLACSHTHTGPVVGTNLITMYPLDDEQRRRVEEYAGVLRDAIVAVVGRAIGDLGPADLAWGTGRADFAVNRRENDQAKVPELRERLALKGPDDHDVPVLRVGGPGGALRAVVFGYACHCTTLSFNKFSGDYAGFAQNDLERSHPGTQAMYVAGCGADQNPLPRGTVAHAERYGKELAEAVGRVLATPLRPIAGPLRSSYEEIDLAFAAIPPRSHWEAEAKADNFSVANRARHLLKRLDAEGALPTSHPYPVEVWQVGDGPTWILLGGEVVVDYSLRLKRNLGSSRTWVSSYCNDVMAYIPSVRVLKEGGYEGATSMVPYGQPAPWSERLEEDIVAAVRKGVAATRRP
jgi:neutral ceramidase